MSEHSGDEHDGNEPEAASLIDRVNDYDSEYNIDYEAMRDADDADIDEETMRRNQTQVMEKRLANFKENHAADNAIIEEIQCTNFMCHSRLHLSLGPLINFIIGHNGSGKSAALTALQLCLGGRATNTNRGQKLADFIKHGEDVCVLSVRIKNQGISAYKPQEYGPSITVERQFNRQGVSTFKLKNSQGRLVSNKRADLEDLTDAFALQLDNPMMCLTQDQAREFLNNSGPKEKYKFFFKGTHLEALDNDYRLMHNTLEELEGRLMNLKDDRDAAKEAYRVAKFKADQAKEYAGAREKHTKLGRQMAWIQVEEQEEVLRQCDKDIQEAQEKVDGSNRVYEGMSDRYDEANVACDELNKTFEELQESAQPHINEKEAVREQFDDGAKSLKELQVQNRSIQGTVSLAQRQINRLTDDIETEQQRIRDADGGQHAQRLADLQQAREESRVLQEKQVAISREARDLDIRKQDAESAADNAKRNTHNRREALTECDKSLRILENSRGQWLRAYADNKDSMRKLLTAIDRETRFHEKPVGPFGRHIRLLKPEWTSIIERSFGNTLSAFCVTNHDDQKIFMDLQRRVGSDYVCLIGNKTPLNTIGKEPDAELLTWARVLEFEDDMVRNSAIINQGIEQTVLFDNLKEALNFMDPRNYGGRPPPNVKQCFAMGDKRGEGHRLGYMTSGGESRAPIKAWTGPSRMKTDDEYQIQEAKERLRSLNDMFKEAEQDQSRLDHEVKEANQAIVRHKRALAELKRQQEQVDSQADQVQDELEDAAARPDKLNGLEEQLQQSRDELQNAENQFQDSFEEKERIHQLQRELKNKLDEIDGQIKTITDEQSKMEVRLKKLTKKRQDALYQKNEAHESTRDAVSAVERLQAAQAAQQLKVDDYVQNATAHCQRVPIEPGSTLRKIEKERDNIAKLIEDSETRLGGTFYDLKRKARVRLAQAQAAINNYKYAVNLSHALKMALQERLIRWRKFRQLISGRARTQFMYLLAERQFRGQLKLKHQEKLLEIQVEPDFTRSSNKGRQTKTLSGGEKSFSTICLLLSLWDAMGNPIRCLDEFDVFMDSVNRDVSMKMMIEAARKSVSKQFILISPQSMSSSHVGPDVHIIK